MAGKAGMTNRNKQFLLNKLRKMYGDDFEPVMKMAGNAAFLQGIADEHQGGYAVLYESTVAELEGVGGQETFEDIKAKAIAATKEANFEWDRIAKYTTPQLKAVEITGDVDVTNHVGLPEVDDIVEDLLDEEADTRFEEDTSD